MEKISVWICQEEKLISGLSRRTTCSDVVRPAGGMLSGPPHSYCIVEKWRGFERILPNKTKILRLWVAWGDEQENVRFVLVRTHGALRWVVLGSTGRHKSTRLLYRQKVATPKLLII
uniref:Ras-associating domain-containing protein n=1 Tax=Junco hyemalis TaxID=40217 RepID=A0A8C5JM99_JUNHY